MPDFPLPRLPSQWVHFSGWIDLGFAIGILLLILLMTIWWRQQTNQWFRIVVSVLLAAVVLCIGSYYFFQVPFHHVGCPEGCVGWRGFPRAIATLEADGSSRVYFLDFTLNLLLLWVLLLGTTIIWRLLALLFEWWRRPFRARLLFVLLVCILPWALLPRILEPPQPVPTGEQVRIAINAQRAAEFTYGVTGPWVHRMALEDIRETTSADQTDQRSRLEQPSMQVCLRGYTYFYLPWRRYRVSLDPTGVTALSISDTGLFGSCWEEE